ncbi:Glu/Leu/Phe/Val family dehydrogenase [Nocardioides pyridinolyticus]
MSTATSTAPADVFELGSEHEQVVFASDPATGLRAVIAIHSTALGPALGGTRFHPYASTADAVQDVLNLSRGMSYKAALAGLDLGGGKAVIIGDPATQKSEALLRAYGRHVQSLGGRYYTACDVGTFSVDMDEIARECSYVTGRTVAHGGAGDSSVLTAYGVFQGMRAAATVAWGGPSLEGRTVGVAGVGKVGHHLVRHLVEAGAQVVVTDVDAAAIELVRDELPDVQVVPTTAALVSGRLDVYAPCALGNALTDEVVETLTATVVCGAANNQLAHPGVEKMLEERGILYAPDYCVNAGGLIQVADELAGFSFERAQQRATGIFETTLRVFDLAASDGVPPAIAADRLAERRMREVGRLRGMWLPRG